MLWMLLVASAPAYESDTLTDRELPLEDTTEVLDAHVQAVVDESIARANAETACDGDAEKAHLLLAKAIHARLSADELVGGRDGLAPFGFDRYSAWIEKGGATHRNFNDRRDVLGDVTLGESLILKWAGVASTVRVNDVLVGTDKLDHFFEEGYVGWKKSKYGQNVDKATAWATKSELTTFGLQTSQTFSFGDLKADHDGLLFYASILDPWTGVAAMGDDGCLKATEPFTWRDWVTWEYDEVLNPPVYTEVAQRAVDRHLTEHRDKYCTSYAAWGGPEYGEHLARVLAAPAEYASSKAPERTDPYALETLCADWHAGSAEPNALPDAGSWASSVP